MGGGGIALCIELLIEILVKLGSFNISGQGVILKKVLVCFSNKKQEGVVVFKKLLVMGLFFIPFLSYGEFISVCDRTPEVRDAIMKKIAQIDSSIECGDDDLTALALSEFTSLFLSEKGITSLKTGDFSGFSSLQYLYLRKNQITSLPEGVFSSLSSLQYIGLEKNQLTSLPEGVFSGLSSLQDIDLEKNQLTSLSEGVFSGLSSLRYIDLEKNQLTSLPEGVFSGLSLLRRVDLYDNPLDEQTKSRIQNLSMFL